MKNQNENNEQLDTKGDDKAEQTSKETDDADAQFLKTKSNADKKNSIENK